MKEDIEKLIKSVFKKELPTPKKVPNEDAPEEMVLGFEQMLSEVSKEIPDPLTGKDREDFVVLLHASALLLGAFVALDHAFDPAKRTTEERRKGCLSTAENLAQKGAETIKKLQRHFFNITTPDAHGNIKVEIHRKEKPDAV